MVLEVFAREEDLNTKGQKINNRKSSFNLCANLVAIVFRN